VAPSDGCARTGVLSLVAFGWALALLGVSWYASEVSAFDRFAAGFYVAPVVALAGLANVVAAIELRGWRTGRWLCGFTGATCLFVSALLASLLLFRG
jgi:hypothetical protein